MSQELRQEEECQEEKEEPEIQSIFFTKIYKELSWKTLRLKTFNTSSELSCLTMQCSIAPSITEIVAS